MADMQCQGACELEAAHQAAATMADAYGQQITELAVENRRLRDAIRRHREETYDHAGVPPLIEDWERDLWSVLSDPA